MLVGVDGAARVLDFGIAKALGRLNTTRDGAIKGKLSYMAPEQLSGRAATRRTDLFAAGIVLCELVAGARLFQADDEAATVGRVLLEAVRAPSVARPGATAAFNRVVMRALERDPTRGSSRRRRWRRRWRARRPRSAREVGAWVRANAGGRLRASRAARGKGRRPSPRRATRAERRARDARCAQCVAGAIVVAVGVVAWFERAIAVAPSFRRPFDRSGPHRAPSRVLRAPRAEPVPRSAARRHIGVTARFAHRPGARRLPAAHARPRLGRAEGRQRRRTSGLLARLGPASMIHADHRRGP